MGEGYINGRTSPRIRSDQIRIGSNGGASGGIYAPLISFDLSLGTPVNIQSINLNVTIQSYGSGFNFSGTPMTASILINDTITSSDFNELTFNNYAFSEEISWFTDRGWIDTGVNYTFPRGIDTLNTGTELSADIYESLSQVLSFNNNNNFAVLILADNYVGSWLNLGG